MDGCQSGKTVFAAVAFCPGIQHFLCLGFAGGPFFFGIGGHTGLIGGAAFGHEQHMAHIHQLAIPGDAVLCQNCLIFCKIGFHFLHGGIQLGILCIIVQVAVAQQFLEILILFHACTGAYQSVQQFLRSRHAIVLGSFGEIFFQGIQIFLLLRGQRHSCCLCLVGQSAVILPGGQGFLQEELLPGVVFCQQTGLGVQRLGVIQHSVGQHHGAILGVQEVLDLHPVEYLQLTVGQRMLSQSGHHSTGGSLHFFIGDGVGALAGLIIGIAVSGDSGFGLGLQNGGVQGGLHVCSRLFGLGAACQKGHDNGCRHHDGTDQQSHLAGCCLLFCRLGLFGSSFFRRFLFGGSFFRRCFFCSGLFCSHLFCSGFCSHLFCSGFCGFFNGSGLLSRNGLLPDLFQILFVFHWLSSFSPSGD